MALRPPITQVLPLTFLPMNTSVYSNNITYMYIKFQANKEFFVKKPYLFTETNPYFENVQSSILRSIKVYGQLDA